MTFKRNAEANEAKIKWPTKSSEQSPRRAKRGLTIRRKLHIAARHKAIQHMFNDRLGGLKALKQM